MIAVDPELKIVGRFNLNASQPTGLIYDPQYHELYVAVRFAVLAISADSGTEIDRVARRRAKKAVARSPVARALRRQ